MNLNRCCAVLLFAALAAAPGVAAAQGLTGALVGTVKDEQGGVLVGARVRVTSPALLGGTVAISSDQRGQWLFPALAPGAYGLDVELDRFAAHHEINIRLDAGVTLEKPIVLKLSSLAESVIVEGTGSNLEARGSGVEARVRRDDFQAIPIRRASMFDPLRMAPGVSPTSPSSGTTTTVSAFGSGTNENLFLLDDTNMTCPCNGVARAEIGVDFIQEVQVQSVGASAEFGNMQGAIVNVLTRSGSNLFQYDGSYYGQWARLTSQPIERPLTAPQTGTSRYERVRYRDATTNLGGPIARNRAWFFAGYQYLRDYDSQPGTNPTFPRTYEQNKVFAKLTWQPAPRWRLVHSLHYENWLNPDRPTLTTPIEATTRLHASVPAMTFGQLTHAQSDRTIWDIRVGRFVYAQETPPSSGDPTIANHLDRTTSISSGGPPQFGTLNIMRTTGKATISHFRSGMAGADHALKAGVQIERGEHDAIAVIPTGVRYEDKNGQPFQTVSAPPSHNGAAFISASAFASDAITIGERLTINTGLRYDYNRAISQDLTTVDVSGAETGAITPGLGTLYAWHVLSPRLGLTMKLTADARTFLRASYGRFSQGVLTGELSSFHPGSAPVLTMAFEPATGGYTKFVSEVNQKNLDLDRHSRPPRTDEYSVGIDRALGRRLTASTAYVHKSGANFIGWTDVGGEYDATTVTAGGKTIPAFALRNTPADRIFRLTNPEGYALTYNGLVVAVEKSRSSRWYARGSYTLSKTTGLQVSSGTSAGAAQVSTIGPPANLTFGRDPNDIYNASGRLPNDRPHMFRLMGSFDVPGTRLLIAANAQYFSGKPWAATAQVPLPQGDVRMLLEPRGTRRLSDQRLLDLRVSRPIPFGRFGRAELMLDILNVLNDTAEEGLASDDIASTNFGKPNVFIDPRRAMLSVRLNLGQ